MRFSLAVLIVAALPALFSPRLAHAQDPASPSTVRQVVPAALSGIVSDPSGAKIVGAQIHVENDTFKRDNTTDTAGHFSVDLPPGTYRFDILSPGFEPYTRVGLVIGSRPGRPLAVSLRIATENEVLTVDANGASTSAGDNQTALVFKGDKLNTLSDNDATLQQQLLALAGGDGQHPPQIYVDGFTGGSFPPKSSIREVRINQNPFSAQYDGLGFGRVEIFTKPGSDKFHGQIQAQGNDQAFNSRNPYTGYQPPYHTLFLDGNLSGPIGKKTSFFGSANYNDQENNAVVNAVTLDADNNQQPLSQAIPNPQTTHRYSARLDRQLSTNNTFTSRYEYNQTLITNGGVGLLTLASEGLNSTSTAQTLQVGNTEIIGPHMINETRFQYIRTRLNQASVSSAPTLVVQGSFNGGGNPAGNSRDNQDRYEFQDYFSLEHGKHFLRAGARYRLLREANLSTGNYNGQYTFPSLAAYQITQQGLAAGLSPAQIRANGGGASQFNLTAGVPTATVLTGDIGLYAEDEWKRTSRLTLNGGLRFESQSAIPDHVDPAPRIGFAYALAQRDKHPAVVVLRGGFGLFFQRFDAGNILTAIRQNGVTQQAYFVSNPDTFPTIPDVTTLPGVQPTPYRIDTNLRSAYDMITSLSAERSLGKYGSLTGSYLNFRSVHQFISLNTNAPLPGTYDPAVPGSGTRPFGNIGNIYQFSSPGLARGNILFTNYNLNFGKRVSIWGFYVHEAFRSDTNGGPSSSGSFPTNSYNVRADYARVLEPRNRIFTGGTFFLPGGATLEPFFIYNSSAPFNITTGSDNNGDTIYNDRPSFATDLTRPSVVRTAFGNFDLSPIAGQQIIPANYGNGPGYVSLQLTAGKSVHFGPLPAPTEPAAGTPPPAPGAKPTPAPKPVRPYELNFSVEADNLFNHNNGATPIGVLTSPFFGRSLSLNAGFFNNSAANRTVTLRSSFRF